MPKTAVRERPSSYRCRECGLALAKWVGRCPECQAWASVQEPGPVGLRTLAPGPVTVAARPIDQVDAAAAAAAPTGVGELDRVLGGGLVPGAVILLAGEPGVGKSTLLLEVAARVARGGRRALLVTGEESAAQVRRRADRMGAIHPEVFLAAETDLGALLGHVATVSPAVLVVDSVQTFGSAQVDGSAGGVTQVREVAAALIRVAKDTGITVLLVGHVTKDGAIAGPRLLEHVVDVVLHFEGDRGSALRLLRAVKNRFGPADEVGCFELRDDGIVGLPDPSGLFLSRHGQPVPGTCVTVAVEGRRALVTEVQALAVRTSANFPRRATSGLDSARLAMLLAVLERRTGTKLSDQEVYAATVGGARVDEPAADLAVALALASTVRDQTCPLDLVVVGEVGLAGEVRPVPAVERRLAEAARLGFRRALIPGDSGLSRPPLPVTEVADLRSGLSHLRGVHER